MLCVRLPGEDHDVARRGVATRSPVLVRCRQLLGDLLMSSRYLSPGEAR
ncbi:hypothetical protein A2U01_0079476 [Trifolium medium]|uniref:Uncharacterized protein n=1 Tax=Trifolium medium TaxID=97028 RepID=A0A392TBE7_9FABA|nr:hypothetical protein [Trifolium medium]